MTPTEFKAWFDGFTEAMDRLPTKAQWARIKDRVAEIDGRAVTERVYVDRWTRYFPTYPVYGTYTVGGVCGSISNTSGGDFARNVSIANNLSSAQGICAQNAGFNSLTAMNTLGKAEAASIS